MKYIKTIPMNNRLFKTREYLNKLLITIKDTKNNNQSENFLIIK